MLFYSTSHLQTLVQYRHPTEIFLFSSIVQQAKLTQLSHHAIHHDKLLYSYERLYKKNWHRRTIIFHNPFWKYSLTIDPLTRYCKTLIYSIPILLFSTAVGGFIYLLVLYMWDIPKILDLCTRLRSHSLLFNGCFTTFFIFTFFPPSSQKRYMVRPTTKFHIKKIRTPCERLNVVFLFYYGDTQKIKWIFEAVK